VVQILKTFTDEQVKELMQRYVNQQVDRKHLQGLLGIKERSFLIYLKNTKMTLKISPSNIIATLTPKSPPDNTPSKFPST